MPPNIDMWEPNPFRIFISHASEQAELARNIKHELRKHSISVFVAKENIQTTGDGPQWIEYALNTTNYVVALITDHSSKSAWVNQEIGFAYAQKTPIISIIYGADPKGFITTSQAIECTGKDAAHIASEIFNSMLHVQPLFEIMWSILINSYTHKPDASQAAHILSTLHQMQSITHEQEHKLVAAINSRQHVYNSTEFLSTTSSELKRLANSTYTTYDRYTPAQLIRFESTNPVWGYTGLVCNTPGTYYSQCFPYHPIPMRTGEQFPLCGSPEGPHLYHAAYWFLQRNG